MSSSESAGDDPIAPWAFRAALSGLPEGEVRNILESDRCPEPHDSSELEETSSFELAGEVVVYHADAEEAWLQSTEAVELEDIR